jgi:crossover junction endodeoxyribonuclease RuvC
MVKLHLPGVKIAGPDAADALAVAICHAHHLQSSSRLQAALRAAE